MSMKFPTIFILLFLILGCTKVELGYRLAPRSTMSKLDDFFDFKSERFKKIRSQLDEDFKNSRSQVGQLVTGHVDEILILNRKSELSAADFKVLMESMQKTRGSLISLFKGSFTVVIADLTVEEVTSLDQFSSKKFKEQDEKLSDKVEFLEKQADSFEKVMDFLFDSATKEQIAIYEKFVTDNYDFFLAQAEFRKGFIKKFESLSSRKPDLLDYVMRYYAGDASTRTPEQLIRLNLFSVDLHEVMAKIWKSVSAKQKENLNSNMLSLKNELNKMVVN